MTRMSWTILLYGGLVIACERIVYQKSNDTDAAPLSGDVSIDPDSNHSFQNNTAKPCESRDPDPADYDYGKDYPDGPYGFKGSLCWDMGEKYWYYEWSGGGDTIHNICLPNHNNETVCLRDLVKSPYDLLIVNFSTGWCVVCAVAATYEDDWGDRLKQAGYNPIYITILTEGLTPSSSATQADAIMWKEGLCAGSESEVLYDKEKKWINLAAIDVWKQSRRASAGSNGVAYPFFFYVNPEKMKIWDSWEAFPTPRQYTSWVEQEIEILNYMKKESR